MQENNAPITRLLMWVNALVMLAVILFNLYAHNQWTLADETP